MIGWRIKVVLNEADGTWRVVVQAEVPMGAEALVEWHGGPRGHGELVEIFGQECVEMVREELAAANPPWPGPLSAVVSAGEIQEPWVAWHPDLRRQVHKATGP